MRVDTRTCIYVCTYAGRHGGMHACRQACLQACMSGCVIITHPFFFFFCGFSLRTRCHVMQCNGKTSPPSPGGGFAAWGRSGFRFPWFDMLSSRNAMPGSEMTDYYTSNGYFVSRRVIFLPFSVSTRFVSSHTCRGCLPALRQPCLPCLALPGSLPVNVPCMP